MARPTPRRTLVRLALLTAALAAPAAADMSFVSDDELAGEIAAREEDLERTRSRLRRIAAEERADREEIETVRRSIAEIETNLVARAALLYRVSRQGAGLRYLLGHGAGTDSLKRIAVLERLVRAGLEQRRAAGLRQAEIEDRLAAAAEESRAARELELRLEASIERLLAERARRGRGD